MVGQGVTVGVGIGSVGSGVSEMTLTRVDFQGWATGQFASRQKHSPAQRVAARVELNPQRQVIVVGLDPFECHRGARVVRPTHQRSAQALDFLACLSPVTAGRGRFIPNTPGELDIGASSRYRLDIAGRLEDLKIKPVAIKRGGLPRGGCLGAPFVLAVRRACAVSVIESAAAVS